MVEHQFIKVEMGHGFLASKPKEDYQKIIVDEQKKGWELVQIFAPAVNGYGVPQYIDIIMKRNVEI